MIEYTSEPQPVTPGASYDRPVVRAPFGNAREVVPLRSIRLPDGWLLAGRLRRAGLNEEAEAVIDLWHAAHDFRANLAGDVGLPDQP